MSLKCKADGCRSANIRGPNNGRYACEECNRIFVTVENNILDPRFSPLTSRRKRLQIESRPECFGNHDPDCVICREDCSDRSSCVRFSPPTTSDYYFVPPSSITGTPVRCPNCGMMDRGKFCSHCGNLLQPEKSQESHVVWQAIYSGLINEWPKYFRTLVLSIVSPRKFYSGAFSQQSRQFHYETGTLESANFIIRNVSLLGILYLILEGVLRPRFVEAHFSPISWLVAGATDLAAHTVLMFFPGILLLLLLEWIQKNPHAFPQRVLLSCPHRITMQNVLKAIGYVAGWEILYAPIILLGDLQDTHVPLVVLADLQLTLDAERSDLVSGWILLLVLYGYKLLLYLKFLPTALTYACRISKEAAGRASVVLMVIPFIIYAWARAFLVLSTL